MCQMMEAVSTEGWAIEPFARRCHNSERTHMVQGDSQSLGHEDVLQTGHKCGKKLLARMQFIVAKKDNGGV